MGHEYSKQGKCLIYLLHYKTFVMLYFYWCMSIFYTSMLLQNPKQSQAVQAYLSLECSPHCEIICYQEKVHLPQIKACIRGGDFECKHFEWFIREGNAQIWKPLYKQAAILEVPFRKKNYQLRCEVHLSEGALMSRDIHVKVHYCERVAPPPNK